jgi:uncharacterized RDD family membrane protein YckC
MDPLEGGPATNSPVDPGAASDVTPAPEAVPYPHLSAWVIPEPAVVPRSGWVVADDVRPRPAPGYEYAGFWRRAWAYLLDGLLVGIPFWIVATPIVANAFAAAGISILFQPSSYQIDPATGMAVMTAATRAALTTMSATLGPLVDLLFFAFSLLEGLYFTVLWSRRGASLGQELLGVEVRTVADGQRISFVRGWLRIFGFFIDGIVLDLGFAWAAFDSRKQGWHDKIAGTVVVKRSGPRTSPAPRWIVALSTGAILVAIGGFVVAVIEISSFVPS